MEPPAQQTLQEFYTEAMRSYVIKRLAVAKSRPAMATSMLSTKTIVLAHPMRPGTVQLKWDYANGMLIVKRVYLEDQATSRGEFTAACEALLKACSVVKTVRLEAVSHERYLQMLKERGWKVSEPITLYTNADFSAPLIVQ